VASLLALTLGAVIFWATVAVKPIYFGDDSANWLKANPKLGTILWTSVGSLLAILTLYLLNGMLLLMSKQVSEKHGATLSTIDGKFKSKFATC
jgi:hypothetical protein